MKHVGLSCPVDPGHGALFDWPTDRWAFHCSHQDHDGFGERPPTRAFFTTQEAESGRLGDEPDTASHTTVPPRSAHEAEAQLALGG